MTELESSTQDKYWLLKAEPDSRVVKGKDVKVSQKTRLTWPLFYLLKTPPDLLSQFNVDDFERVKTSPWEGVRNYEARNLMKEMKVGDKVSKPFVFRIGIYLLLGVILPFELQESW